MALTIGNITNTSLTFAGETSLSFAHTQDAGADGHLYVIVSMGPADTAPTGFDYNGVSMTHKETTAADSLNGTFWMLYELDAPATGSNNVTVNYPQYTYYQTMYITVISTTGSNGVGNTVFANSAASPNAANLSSVSSGSTTVLSGTVLTGGTTTLVIDGTSYTSPFTYTYTRGSINFNLDYKESVASGTNSLQHTASQIAGYAFEITAAAAPPSTSRVTIIS